MEKQIIVDGIALKNDLAGWHLLTAHFLEDEMMGPYGYTLAITTIVQDERFVVLTPDEEAIKIVQSQLLIKSTEHKDYNGKARTVAVLFNPGRKHCVVPNVSRTRIGVHKFKLFSGKDVLKLLNNKQLKWD